MKSVVFIVSLCSATLLFSAVPTAEQIKGPFLIASTPYHTDGTVDYDSLVAEAYYMDAAGCSGIIWPQSNDSIDLLTIDERLEGMRRLVVAAQTFTNAVLTLGVNGEDTQEMCIIATCAEKLAATSKAPIAFAARPPTNGKTKEDVTSYYEALAQIAKRPVIIQTFVSDECPAPEISFLVDLAQRFPNIYGYIKEESEGNCANVRQAEEIAFKPIIKTVFSAWGGWQWLYQWRAIGTEGLISERPAYAPLIVRIWQEMQAGDPNGKLQTLYSIYRYMIDQRAIPVGSLRGYSLYYLQKLGIFKNTLSRTYLKSRTTESGTFGEGHEWKLVDLTLTNVQKAELDANFEGMERALKK